VVAIALGRITGALYPRVRVRCARPAVR
jgi:hypothetical protein